jgi:hypothetical protein
MRGLHWQGRHLPPRILASSKLPVLDVSLGVIDQQVQIGATYPYVIADPEGQDSDSDFGNLELGVKWRFWNSEDLQVAFAPLTRRLVTPAWTRGETDPIKESDPLIS